MKRSMSVSKMHSCFLFVLKIATLHSHKVYCLYIIILAENGGKVLQSCDIYDKIIL